MYIGGLGEYGRLRSPSNRKSPTQLSVPKDGKEKETVFSEPKSETHEESQLLGRFRSFVITTQITKEKDRRKRRKRQVKQRR